MSASFFKTLLNRLTSADKRFGFKVNRTDLQKQDAKDLIISHNEINHRHGVGILLNRIFDPPTCLNIRSREQYPGDVGPFTSFHIDAVGKPLPMLTSLVSAILSRQHIKRIICVPYYPEDYLIGVIAKRILSVPMVVWIMDDTSLIDSLVSQNIALELFDAADVRFAISAEMRDIYKTAFERKFYILPPTVNCSLIGQFPQANISQNMETKTCVMIGNVWCRTWLENLFRLIKKSDWTIHWYGDGTACPWLSTSAGELSDHNIIEKGFLPETAFLQSVSKYPFAIVPSGSGAEDDDRRGITLLSLPSRIPFLLATTHIPILVVGSEKSCAARFVHRFKIGISTDYNESQFLAAVTRLSDPAFRSECFDNAAASAKIFSHEGLVDWIRRCCDSRVVTDDRFERFFPRSTDLEKHIDQIFKSRGGEKG